MQHRALHHAELILIHWLVPGTSFTGHLAGVAAGWLHVHVSAVPATVCLPCACCPDVGLFTISDRHHHYMVGHYHLHVCYCFVVPAGVQPPARCPHAPVEINSKGG
jgi:hypothetical protein